MGKRSKRIRYKRYRNKKSKKKGGIFSIFSRRSERKKAKKLRKQRAEEYSRKRKQRKSQLEPLQNAFNNGSINGIIDVLNNTHPQILIQQDIDIEHPIVPHINYRSKGKNAIGNPKIIKEILLYAKENFTKLEQQLVVNGLMRTAILVATDIIMKEDVESDFDYDRYLKITKNKKVPKDTRTFSKKYKNMLNIIKLLLRLGANRFDVNFESGEIDNSILELLQPFNKEGIYPINDTKKKYYKGPKIDKIVTQEELDELEYQKSRKSKRRRSRSTNY